MENRVAVVSMSQASIATQSAAMKTERVQFKQQMQEQAATRNADKARRDQAAGVQRDAADAQQAQTAKATAEANRAQQAAAEKTVQRARQTEAQISRPKPSVNAQGQTTGQIISVTA
jgi:hypothetical protein